MMSFDFLSGQKFEIAAINNESKIEATDTNADDFSNQMIRNSISRTNFD
jgi:hypothetical protein